MVKITAALAWYDEPPEFLYRCVQSLDGLVDEVVALDGAWRWFPGGGEVSRPQEIKAIREGARLAGIKARIVVPEAVFESQVHKRAVLMEEASTDSDWVFVIDADEWVTECDAEMVRVQLSTTTALVGSVEVRNLHQGDPPPADYHPEGGLRRRFYRSGTTVVIVHSGYSYHGKHLLPGEPTIDLGGYVKIDHDICNRGQDRNRRAREYREARTRERVEVWV